MGNKVLWVAVVIAEHEESGQVLSSFLTVHASNRYKAQIEVEKALPNNRKYLRENGELRPYRFLELCQVKERELPFYQAAFFEMFQQVFGGDLSDLQAHAI